MSKRKKLEMWTGLLPWQLETLLLIPGFAGAAFALWNVYGELMTRTSLLANAFGVEFDVVPLLWQMRFPVGLIALTAAVQWHQLARRWICRKFAFV